MRGSVSNAYWWALGAAAVLFVISRTSPGQAAIASAADSIASTVRGLRNKNPGNLRANQYRGVLGVDAEGYAVYATLADGIRAAAKQVKTNVGRGLDTVTKMIQSWAPNTENDTAAYIADVSADIGRGANARLVLDESMHLALLRAIFKHELGVLAAATISDAQIVQGIRDI